MNPEFFGRGSWLYIFICFYIYEDVEEIKYILEIIINSLPCSDCRNHTFEHMKKNKIFESTVLLYIFHFFVELYNKFHTKKIDRTKFDDELNFKLNKKYLFDTIIS